MWIIFFLIVISSGCMSSVYLVNKSTEFDLLDDRAGKYDINNLGNGKILVYVGGKNVEEITVKVTSQANDIYEKAIGTMVRKEYALLELKEGIYVFQLYSINNRKLIQTRHMIYINKDTKVIKVLPKKKTNVLEVTNELPKKYLEFRNISEKTENLRKYRRN